MNNKRIKILITPAIARRSGGYLDNCGCLLGTACAHLGQPFVGHIFLNIDTRRYSISTRNANRISAAYGRNQSRAKPVVRQSFTVTLTPYQ